MEMSVGPGKGRHSIRELVPSYKPDPSRGSVEILLMSGSLLIIDLLIILFTPLPGAGVCQSSLLASSVS